VWETEFYTVPPYEVYFLQKIGHYNVRVKIIFHLE